MCFYYLLLGHLLGDFTFQTDRIAYKKVTSNKWNILHSVIVTSCMMILSFRFGFRILMLVAASGVLHFLIDYCKYKFTAKNNFQSLVCFLIDQAAHIYIIYLISLFPHKDIPVGGLESRILFFTLALVFTVSFCGIFIQYLLKIFFPSYKKFFNGNEKTVGQITRFTLFIAIYASLSYSFFFAAALPLVIFIEIYYYNKYMKGWMSRAYFSAATLFNIAFPVIGMYIFYNINV